MELIRERTGGEVISDSILLLRKYWRPLVQLFIPIYVLQITNELIFFNYSDNFIASLVNFSIFIFLISYNYAVMSLAISQICIGQKTSIGLTISAVNSNIWSIIGVSLIYYTTIMIGYMLLLVPGIMFSIWWLFSIPVVIIEKRSIIDSMRRSRKLGHGYFWRNLKVSYGISFFFIAMLLLIILIISFLIGTIDVLFQSDFSNSVGESLWGVTLAAMAALVPIIIIQIASILLYYDMRVRNEGYDAAALTQELMAQ